METENHIFQGLKRDNHPIRQDSKFLWDAHNIRLTRRDGNTLLSVTNERGTSTSLQLENNNFTGHYLGHCVLDKYLVVFTIDDDGITYIYRVVYENNKYINELLFSGDLGMSVDNPVETLGIQETGLINKVYWIDGINQPRVINITKKELKEEEEFNYYPTEFDFVQTLELNEEIEITKNFGSGIFSPGTIQYAFTYYNKYGQESNIFYTSPIQYISFTDRAGSPEDRVANSFTITVKNLDKHFDYLRIYSIHRTSIDAVPTVKKLNDISLDSAENEISFTDFGNTGSIEDPTKLLYIGGRDIVPQCFAHKDGTLFLGNIKIQSPDREVLTALEALKPIKDDSGEYHEVEGGVTFKEGEIYKSYTSNPILTYYIKNNFNLDKGYNAGFKTNETYRLGIQAQLSNGTWTSPVHLKDDILCKTYPKMDRGRDSSDFGKYNDCFIQYGTYVTIPSLAVNELKNKYGVKNLRLCVVFPQTYERDIICQGILNPTVYNGYSRSKNAPFAQASWFFRPSKHIWDPTLENVLGGNIEFRHNYALKAFGYYGREIQSMKFHADSENPEYSGEGDKSTIKGVVDPVERSTDFFVDENIVTLNSPDVEFDTNLVNLDYSDVSLRILGYAELNSIYGDVDIKTSSPTASEKAAGFVHNTVGYNVNTEARNRNNGGWVSQFVYNDAYINVNDDAEGITERYKVSEDLRDYLVYTWNRSGSLNNDVNREDGGGQRTSVLDTKVIANLKVFNPYRAIDVFEGGKKYRDKNIFSISTPQIFNADTLAILKVDIDYLKRSDYIQSISGIYEGNIDTLLAPTEEYSIPWKTGSSTKKTKDPIRMKYKSTPHMVFRLKGDKDTQTLLPRRTDVNDPAKDLFDNRLTYPDWMTTGVPESTLSDKELFENDLNYCGGLDSIGYNFVVEDHDVNEVYKRTLLDNEGKLVFGMYKGALVVGKVQYSGDSEYCKVVYPDRRNPTKNCIFKIESATDIVVTDEFNIIESLGIESDKYDKTTIYVKIDDKEYPEEHYQLTEDIYLRISETGSYELATRSSAGIIDDSGNAYVQYNQATFDNDDPLEDRSPYLLIAELVRKTDSTEKDLKFGGDTPQALQQNLWLPASDPMKLGDGDVTLICKYGDTWYSRYDCLKTYPFTEEDPNQVVEIGSFMCETRINLNGRYDRNKGQLSNIHSRPTNFNLINEVYNQKDNFFTYRIYDKDFYKQNIFTNQITWTTEKIYGSDVDNWTNITLASTLDLNGAQGELKSLNVSREKLIGFQDKAVNIINFNSRVQIPASDGVPIEISNSYKVDGYTTVSNIIGCSNKWSIVDTNSGLHFLDPNTNDLYVYGEQNLLNLSSEKGLEFWTKQYADLKSWFPTGSDRLRNGIRSFYDATYGDVYYSPGAIDNGEHEALCFSESIAQFTSFMNYGGVQAMFNFNDGFYSLKEVDGVLNLYQNNVGPYNFFYNDYKSYSLTFISNDNPLNTKIFDTIELRSDLYNPKLVGDEYSTKVQSGQPFNYIRVDNEYQDTKEVAFNAMNLRKKFRIWRALIPRNKKHSNGRDRIRNPWAKITIGYNNPEDQMTILHDVSVKYTL